MIGGNGGADTFVFGEESINAETDMVKDFSQKQDDESDPQNNGDRLDLRGLAETKGYSKLKFIGAANCLADGATNPDFTGEVRYSHRGDANTTDSTLYTDVTADLDRNGRVDFQVTLMGEEYYTLTDADFLLA